MNHSQKCLNCESEVNGNFCAYCGQKTAIHRINFKNFITHDFLHGLFHVEKGMLFTAKESLIRPGKAGLDYIDGKRKRYYNVFYFILVLIGINIFLGNYYDHLTEIYTTYDTKEVNNTLMNKIDQFYSDYSKIIIFSFIPLLAINSFILFRKRKLYFSEHLIIAGITILGILLIYTVYIMLSFFYFTAYFNVIAKISDIIVSIITLLFPIFSYYQAFKDYHKKVPFFFRMILFTLFMFIELIAFLLITVVILSNWKFITVS